MATAKETILIKAKGLLGITDTTKDDILNFYIDLIVQMILDYCNREDFPDELIPFATSKVVASYQSDNGGATETGGKRTVRKLKSGDVSFEFAGDDVNRGFANVAVGELSAGEKSQLATHRRLGFQ